MARWLSCPRRCRGSSGGVRRSSHPRRVAGAAARSGSEAPVFASPQLVPDLPARRPSFATAAAMGKVPVFLCDVRFPCVVAMGKVPVFSAVGAPAPSAHAETPPPTAADTSLVLASPLANSYPLLQQGQRLQHGRLLTAATLVPDSPSASSTALGLSPAYARRPPADSSAKGAGIFSTNSLCRVPFSRAGHQFELPWYMSSCPSYSTSSRNFQSKSDQTEDPPVTYVIGMFDDVNEPKWNPLEFAESHALLENVNLVGDEEAKEYTIFTELAKVWFASLPLLIEKLKMHGYSFFHPITLSQLMVDRHGQFVMRGGTLLWKTNRHNASKDYFSLAGVYEDIIRHCCRGAILPYSFEDLLKELRHRNQPHGYYFTVHPVFIPVPTYSQAYLDVYDHVKENLTGDQAKWIWISLVGSAKKWAESMAGNTLLVAWFEDPYKQNWYIEEEDRFTIGNAKHLFRYLRHVHSRLLVYVKLLGVKYTKNEARVMVECKFSRAMTGLFRKLWEHKFLVDIETEAYFCKPGGACCPRPGFCLRKKLRLTIQESQKRKRMEMENVKNQTADAIKRPRFSSPPALNDW